MVALFLAIVYSSKIKTLTNETLIEDNYDNLKYGIFLLKYSWLASFF